MATAKERRAARVRAAAAETGPATTATAAAVDDSAGVPDPESDEILEEARARSTRPPKSTIHRVNPENGSRMWLAEVATDLIAEDYIARRFGGGKYYISHRRAQPGGGYVYDSHTMYDLDPSLKADPPAPAIANGNGHNGASSPAPVSASQLLDVGFLQLLRQIEQGNESHRVMLERIAKMDSGARAPSPFDDVLKLILPVVAKGLMDMIANRNDPIDQALKLRRLVPDAEAPDLIGTLEKTLQLAARLNNGGRSSSSDGDGDGDGMSKMILEGMRTLRELLAPRVNGQPIAIVDAPAAVDPHQTASDFTTTADAGGDVVGSIPPQRMASSSSNGVADRPWLAAARPQLPTLLQFARFMPADAAASTIASNLTPAQLDDLLEDLDDDTAPGFFGRLAQQFPEAVAAAPPAWLQQVAGVLVSWSDDVDDDSSEAPPAPTPAK